MQSLIDQGLGISILPEMATGRPGSRGIVYRRLADHGPSRTIAVAWRKHRYHTTAAARLMDVLRTRRRR
jgi:DNA-binding transcriptional LysR family regulator